MIVLETGFHFVNLTGLLPTVWSRLDSNSRQSPCLIMLSAGSESLSVKSREMIEHVSMFRFSALMLRRAVIWRYLGMDLQRGGYLSHSRSVLPVSI